MYQPQNGWAEQKPEDWREAGAGNYHQSGMKESGVDKDEIKGIGISGPDARPCDVR